MPMSVEPKALIFNRSSFHSSPFFRKTRLLAVADIFGQDIPDVRSFRFPGEYFRVEMVRVGRGRQNIQPSGAFQKVPVYIKLRGIPIIIDQNG